MNNLNIENIAGGASKLDMGGGISNAASEARIAREMVKQGLEAPSVPTGEGKSFADLLQKSVSSVNADQQQADFAMKELVAGRTKNIHETMLAVEKADTSLKIMMQVRNKVLDAYREIMRMQV